ncbi:sterile alpha motif domain-containing protein 3-like [Notolabrus celidotus]|uniref:sterile alpha motif domain-containing protein 3-like n=1 Tax=Notolabrus celidotus TaxID=1203425 RepID=UPI00148F73B0|nr:sterile alpha motif domain-containing protein 3-like [Notolabrus celidotus]XP_034542212.1 sterile alpha motif domain-containing protein 3-like [Notolabrus celidotus]XP_034542213.1 sterile alpha motif domain-containing protein 3-like [Notolabrus celidotus]XP_034542214.1 sterile alpha motif domain-containing protein 3-like [Notolabrus celidotus]
MDPAVLRVIFGHRIEKLTLLSGIPDTIEELNFAIKHQLNITCVFSLQYLDPDFDDFFSLHSTTQIKHKATVKVVTTEPVVLNLHPLSHNESYDGSVTSEQSFSPPSTSSMAQDSLDSSDSSSTIILSPNRNSQRKPWPMEFILPEFSVETEIILDRANEVYKKDGTLLRIPNIRSDILDKLAQTIYTYTAYPSSLQVLSVAEALIKTHPCLKDPGSSSGLSAWQTSIKYKMSNYRTKLRGFGIPDVTCNALKHKCPDDRKSAKNVKKARRAEVNYLPPYPAGEDEHSLEKTREELVSELKKKNNQKIVNDKMSKTFALRRHEVINQCPSVRAMKDRWPALFDCSQISAEFQRITTVPLEPRFMSSLDLHTPKLLKLFHAKGGALGQRLKNIMEPLEVSMCSSVERTREVVLRCLVEYLGEHGDDLIKEFNGTEDSEELEQLVVAITVTTKAEHSPSDNSKEVGVVIEGMEVVTGLGDIARACCLLLGLTYALNLDYPRQLKNTFEVFQKLFMELDASKLSKKVQSFKSKLLA